MPAVAVAMQRERPLVGTIELRPFPVHADAREPRRARRARRPDRATSRRRPDRIAACDTASSTAPRDRRAICRPACAARHRLVGRAGSSTVPVMRRPSMTMCSTTLKCCACSSSIILLRIGKVLGLPGELAVARVPARRRELGAEIDQRVARQLLLAERPRHPSISSGPASVRCDCM